MQQSIAPVQIPSVCEACAQAGHINFVVTPQAIKYVIWHGAICCPLEIAFQDVLKNHKRGRQCAVPVGGNVDRGPWAEHIKNLFFLAAPEGLHSCRLRYMPHHSDMSVSPVMTAGLHRSDNQKRERLLVDQGALHTDQQETTWADDGAAHGLATLGVCVMPPIRTNDSAGIRTMSAPRNNCVMMSVGNDVGA